MTRVILAVALIAAWSVGVEFEKRHGLVPIGFYLMLFGVAVFGVLHWLGRPNGRYGIVLQGFAFAIVAALMITSWSAHQGKKATLDLILELRKFKAKNERLPTEKEIGGRFENFYGIGYHDLIYVKDEGSRVVELGYRTPLATWNWEVNSDLVQAENIFNPE